MAWFIAFFALGFVALAALWSAAGALSSRVQDIASTTMPLQMVLLVRLGARIYDRNLMQTGRKIGFGEALGRR